MLDLSLFRNRTFGGANAVMLLVGLAMFGTFFYVSLYMQNVLAYSPVEAGASFLPMTILIILIAPQAGAPDRPRRLALARRRRHDAARADAPLYSQLGADESFWALLPGDAARRRSGMAMTMTPVTAAAMSAVARRQGRRRLGGAELLAPGRRLARDRDHGRDRRVEPSSYLTGFHDALEVGALLCLAGAIVAVGHDPQDRAPAAREPPRRRDRAGRDRTA